MARNMKRYTCNGTLVYTGGYEVYMDCSAWSLPVFLGSVMGSGMYAFPLNLKPEHRP